MTRALFSVLALVLITGITGITPRPAVETLLAQSIADARSSCRAGDRGQPIVVERVASRPTAASVRDYFDEWIAFYQDFYQFPPDIPVTFDYGFDSYRITYCTVDAMLPGASTTRPVSATGMLSVPRKRGALSTVAYLHGTSVSFYDAVSNPNIFGRFNVNGESFDGPPSNAVFAGAGFIYVGPDYLGLGESPVPRHGSFHAATESSSAVDLLAASRKVLASLRVPQNDKLFTFGFSQGGHSALALHRELQRAGVRRDRYGHGGRCLRHRAVLPGVSRQRDDHHGAVVCLLCPARLRRRLRRVRQNSGRLPGPVRIDRREASSTCAISSMTSSQGCLRIHSSCSGRRFWRRFTRIRSIPLRVRLRQNAVDRWTPYAPLRIYHSPDDEEVPYQKALESVDRLRRQGRRHQRPGASWLRPRKQLGSGDAAGGEMVRSLE